jgi:hypothetical protein
MYIRIEATIRLNVSEDANRSDIANALLAELGLAYYKLEDLNYQIIIED